MNKVIYFTFSLTARFVSYTSAVASCSAYSAPVSALFAYFFIVGANLPLSVETWLAFAMGTTVSFLGHGVTFGALTKFGVPAFSRRFRALNNLIYFRDGAPHLPNSTSLLQLKETLNLLSDLPRRNSQAGMFWLSILILCVFPFLYAQGVNGYHLLLFVVTFGLSIFMHGSFSFILAELAISRVVAQCRGLILVHEPEFKSPIRSSLRAKFGILTGVFVVALLNLFIITSVSGQKITQVYASLFGSILIVGLLGYLVLYRIITSLREITLASARLQSGTYDLIQSKTLDKEFIEIFQGLNSATLAIQDHQQNLEQKITDRTRELNAEKEKSESLLRNILPDEVADELKQKGAATPREYISTTVLFTDFVGFTKIAEQLTATALVRELDQCFSYFDNVAQKYGLEKLKTIGDAYMAAGGIPVENNTHPIDCALAALEIQAFMNQMKDIKEQQGLPYWELRLGMHTGSLVAGVVGEKKFAYDVWGDTVNTASRMESSGEAGAINISRELYDQLRFLFVCEYRGKVYAKNKGEIAMYFLRGLKPRFSINGEGRVPNEVFKTIYEKIRAGARLVEKKASKNRETA